MSKVLWDFGNTQRPTWTLLTAVRVPLIIVAVFAAFVLDLAFEGVSADAARLVAVDRPYQLWLLALLILIAGIALRFCSELMISILAPDLRTHGRVMWASARTLPRLIGASLGLLVSFRFYVVLTEQGGSVLNAAERLRASGAIAAYVAVALLSAAAPRRLFVEDHAQEQSLWRRFLAQEPWTHAISALLLLAAIGTFFLFWDWTNVAPAQHVGPFGVLVLWAFAAVMYFTPAALLSHVARFPFLLLLVAWAFLISAFNCNDNHEIRTVQGAAPPGECADLDAEAQLIIRPCRPYYDEGSSLFEWLNSRDDLDQYEHYPVFVVAAEGGGIRSSYLTARALEIIQRRYPKFVHHTFAISGVSGGSVGAAGFVQFLDAQSRFPELKNRSLSKVFAEDHLSPLLASTLFGDALQRLLPHALNELDRARSLECSYERAMSSLIRRPGSKDCSERSVRLSDLYGAGRRRLPDLFLNMTRVSDGALIHIGTRSARLHDASRVIDLGGANLLNEINPVERPYRDLPISTAAFLSARFPFILPAARLPKAADGSDGDRVIDGGVFENSGVRNAMHIIDAFIDASGYLYRGDMKDEARKALKRGLDFRLLVLRWIPCDPDCEADAASSWELRERPGEAATEGFAELGSPIRALLRARVAHGLDELTTLKREIRRWEDHLKLTKCRLPLVSNQYRADVLVFRGSSAIPLSWTLSGWARNDLEAALRRTLSSYSPFKEGPSPLSASEDCKTVEPTRAEETEPSATEETEGRKTLLGKEERKTPTEEGERKEEKCVSGEPGQREEVGTALPTAKPQCRRDPMPVLPELDRCESCEPERAPSNVRKY